MTEAEAEVSLAAPALLATCRALLALLEARPRMHEHDPELRALAVQARQAVAGLPDAPADR